MDNKGILTEGDFTSLIGNTEIMQQVNKSLKDEPAQILKGICREFEKTGQPVPDYRLRLSGYIGEVSLKALMQANLVSQHSGGRLSIFSYSPTDIGILHYRKMVETGKT